MLSSKHRKSSKKISNHNNNEQWSSFLQQIIFIKNQNFKQKQCQDCLREAYLHKLLSNSFICGGKTYKTNYQWIKCKTNWITKNPTFITKKEPMKSSRYREDNCLVYTYLHNISTRKYKYTGISCSNIFIYPHYFENSKN